MATSSLSISMSRSQVLVGDRQIGSESVKTNSSRSDQSKKSPYQVDQQVKFLHLEAEVEYLLQQLQNLKQQRQATTSSLRE
jgi:hypothetical protein